MVLIWLASSWLPVLTRTNPAPRLTGVLLPGCCRTCAHYPTTYDPIVLSHATALLKSMPGGACQYVHADLRDPRKILAEAVKTLDFGQPIALMILMTLQYIPDADDP